MAEIAVNFVIDKLVSLPSQEVNLLRGVRKEVASIKGGLESIRTFLRDADSKAEIVDDAKDWVKQLREVAYDMEDVIDEYILHLAERPHQRGFTAFLQKSVRFIKKLRHRHGIATEIQGIKATISDIKEKRETFRFNSSEQDSSSSVQSFAWTDPRLASLFIEEADLVGIEGPKHQVISWLEEGESKRTVISLVGMGGLGKTTLAKKVFDDQIVKGCFDCNAWFTVSQSYKMEEILRTIIKEFHRSRKEEFSVEEIDTMEGLHLLHKLRNYLQEKRYLVVFDDVWAIDFWGPIEHALPNYEKSSRIIITTRNRDVAASCDQFSPHVFELQPLPTDMALELFCKKVFHFDCCPKELEQLSLNIVKKCQGLPLAIVVIGGILSRKDKIALQWKTFHDSLPSELESNSHLTSITKILLLSYHDLPYHLKSCFLYFGLFPEDYSIRCVRLIRLWIAEGFIQEIRGKSLEDIAEEYLKELTQRSLVQISKVDFDGRARQCRVHDLMREIILSKFDELNFCRPVAENKDLHFDGSVRCLAIHKYEEKIPETTYNFSKVRSILLFEVNYFPKQLTDTFFTSYRLLKVLDFENAGFLKNVPEEVGKLFHLRYLSVRKTQVRVLPKSIGKLHNLETLDLKHTFVNELPNEILGLHKLRHLLAYCINYEADFSLGTILGVKMPEGIVSLKALQKLFYVEADGHGNCLVKDLEKLTQLRKLGIVKLKTVNGKALCAAVAKMNGLLSLIVSSINEEEILDLQSISSPPLLLQRLYLQGCLEKLPSWISKLQNVVRIRLNWSRLLHDPLNVLQALSNLLELVLCQAYDGEHLHFEASGFQKLKKLYLGQLDNLSLVTIDRGALPMLKELTIGHCAKLKEVPPGIQSLTSLKYLDFWEMPNEFTIRMRSDGGPDYWKVKDIPNVRYASKTTVGQYQDIQFKRN